MSARLVLFAVLAAPAMAQQLEPEQASLLEQARQAAMQYSASLPDFLCTEIISRRQVPLGNQRWESKDTLTVTLSYSEHREDHKLVQFDGQPTSLAYRSVTGSVSTGEFGGILYSVFRPESHGDFRWKGWTILRNRRVARYSYRIGAERAAYVLRYAQEHEAPRAIAVAFHGDVYVDEKTHMTLEWTLRAEIPGGFPIEEAESRVDYEYAAVGGRQFLLPSHAYVKSRNRGYVSENKVKFRDYRKFQTDANITFDPPSDKE